MFVLTLISLVLTGPLAPQGHIGIWDGGNPVLIQHADKFDITLADFQSRTREDQIREPGPRGGTSDIHFAADRFTVVQSTRHAPGDTLDAVTAQGFHSPASLQPGKRYLLVTYPQHDGKLDFLRDQLETNTVRYDLKVVATYPAKSAYEETCQVALLSNASALDFGNAPWQTLIVSAADCLSYPDPTAMWSAFQFLTTCGYPDPSPDPYPDIYDRIHHPGNVATAAITGKAEAAPAYVRAAIYYLMNEWGLKGLGPFELASLIACADDPKLELYTVNPEGWQMMVWPDSTIDDVPRLNPADTVRVLSTAKNDRVVRYLLLKAPEGTTLAQDKQLAVWLDSPKIEIRYYAAHHFALARRRPDLDPTRTTVNNMPAYPDLDQKVEAWKEFFAKN